MKAQFIVTIEGKWLENDTPCSKASAIKMLRSAVNNEFQFLAKKVTVVSFSAPLADKTGGGE